MTLIIRDRHTHRDTEVVMEMDMVMVVETSPPRISCTLAHQDGVMTRMRGAITIILGVLIMILIATDIIQLVIAQDVCKQRPILMDGKVAANTLLHQAKFETTNLITPNIGKNVTAA